MCDSLYNNKTKKGMMMTSSFARYPGLLTYNYPFIKPKNELHIDLKRFWAFLLVITTNAKFTHKDLLLFSTLILFRFFILSFSQTINVYLSDLCVSRGDERVIRTHLRSSGNPNRILVTRFHT